MKILEMFSINLVVFIAEMPLSVNLFRLESLIQKHAGPGAHPRLGVRGPAHFYIIWRKNNEAGNSLNAVECETVPTRILNPNAIEASYKLKQRSYRKTKLKKTGGEKT